MANRLKSKKRQTTDSGKLKPEKDPQVTVKQIVKDERTHKITGAVLLLLAVFLFIAFTSYLFTWKEDQDKVLHGSAILWPSSEVKVANLLGHLGAWVSYTSSSIMGSGWLPICSAGSPSSSVQTSCSSAASLRSPVISDI